MTSNPEQQHVTKGLQETSSITMSSTEKEILRTIGRMPGWVNPRLESRLPGEISTTSDTQMIPL